MITDFPKLEIKKKTKMFVQIKIISHTTTENRKKIKIKKAKVSTFFCMAKLQFLLIKKKK